MTEECDRKEQTKSGYPSNLGGRKYLGRAVPPPSAARVPLMIHQPARIKVGDPNLSKPGGGAGEEG